MPFTVKQRYFNIVSLYFNHAKCEAVPSLIPKEPWLQVRPLPLCQKSPQKTVETAMAGVDRGFACRVRFTPSGFPYFLIAKWIFDACSYHPSAQPSPSTLLSCVRRDFHILVVLVHSVQTSFRRLTVNTYQLRSDENDVFRFQNGLLGGF